jgi:ribosomal protein L37AE/L43A
MDFICPKCGGRVELVRLKPWSFRWTCSQCRRDYGYNISAPTFTKNYKQLTADEAEEFLRQERAI